MGCKAGMDTSNRTRISYPYCKSYRHSLVLQAVAKSLNVIVTVMFVKCTGFVALIWAMKSA